MDYEEFVKMSEKARRETEDFINHHIHDQTKNWPVICCPEQFKQDSPQMKPCRTCSPIHAAATLPPQLLKHCKAG